MKIIDKWEKIEVIFELLIFGIIIGILEDLIVIKFATDAKITPHVIGIVILIAIPFAIIGEIIFDRIDFADFLRRTFERKK